MTAKEQELMKELLEALEEAYKHLEWCGYGDSYERECAKEQLLPQKLGMTIAKARRKMGLPERKD